MFPRPRRRLAAAAAPPPASDRPDPSGLAPLATEGVILHRHLTAAGLAVPQLLGVVGRAGGYGARSGRPLPDMDAATAFLAGEAPPAFAIRPSAGPGGGTRVFTREGAELVEAGGRRTTTGRLVAELFEGPAEMHLVQERLLGHPDWSRTGAPAPLHLTTAVGATGPELVSCEPSLSRTPPDWDAAVALVRAAAATLLPLRAIRWSVALTTGGPRLLGARPVAASPRDTPAPAPRPLAQVAR